MAGPAVSCGSWWRGGGGRGRELSRWEGGENWDTYHGRQSCFPGIADKATSVLIGLVFPTMNKLGIFTEVNYNKKEKKDRRRKEESCFCDSSK